MHLKRPEPQKEKARAAAKTIADYENRFNKIDAELQLMKWMIGGCLALSGTVIGLLLNIVFKGVKTLP